MKSRRIATAVALATIVGCGGEFPIAPVAGVVTLDGEPLPEASVYFQPQRRGDDPIVGPASQGVTDSEGRFTLSTVHGQAGAVVGRHSVSVSTYSSRLVDPKNSDRIEVVSPERVPPKYRVPGQLTFEVPAGGASEANFDLTSQ